MEKPPKKESKYNLRKRKKKIDYKINEESDDSESSYDPDHEQESEEESEILQDEFNKKEYQKFISKLFPST